MGNDPINVCTPAIQDCQPGPASPNTCTMADDPVTCGGTTPICCKEITGLGALPFTCVANALDCPTVTSSTSSTTTACVADGADCDTSSGSPPCCTSSECFYFCVFPEPQSLFTYNTFVYLLLPILLASTCVNNSGTKTCQACIATGLECESSGPDCCDESEFSHFCFFPEISSYVYYL